MSLEWGVTALMPCCCTLDFCKHHAPSDTENHLSLQHCVQQIQRWHMSQCTPQVNRCRTIADANVLARVPFLYIKHHSTAHTAASNRVLV